MTELSLAARNLLAQQSSVRSLVPKSQAWDTYIFSDSPLGAKIEGTSKSLIVVTEGRQWTTPNPHNTMRFPTLYVDIWSDPTRNADKSVQVQDAKNKIEKIHKAILPFLHTTSLSTGPGGKARIWGTAAEIENQTGVFVLGSSLNSGPDFSPIDGTDGAWMGRYEYHVNVI